MKIIVILENFETRLLSLRNFP